MNYKNSSTSRKGEYFALALIYCFSVANVLKIKEITLSEGGYRIVSRIAGESEATIGWLPRLHFYSADIILLMGLIPVVLVGLARFVNPRVFARIVLLLSLGLVGLSFVNINALGITGKFFSVDQVAPILTWVQERPDTVFEYVSPSALSKLGAIIALIYTVYRFRKASLFSSFTPAPVLLFAVACVANMLSVYAWETDHIPDTRFHAAAAIQMSEALLADDTSRVSPDDMKRAAERLAYACEPPASRGKTAPASEKRNFLLFVMETVPYELFAGADAADTGTFHELEKSGYRSTQHFSTYPFTSYARFSIFTGLYPSYRLEKTLPLGAQHPYRSFFSALVGQGYDFKVFDPVTKRYEVDDWLVHQLQGQVVSADTDGNVKEKDGQVLQKLIEHIGHAERSGLPFVYAYLPQITHGPWLAPGASKEALYKEGRDRLRQLDASLAAIVGALKQNGMYENTVIVVTADHGLRTKKEAEFLKTSVLNEVSYHVPMLIHDPRMNKRVEIDGPTSHLDISPTLHCLYGAQSAQIDTQGRTMTAALSRPRMLHFGGAWYNGSEGLWDGSAFYSYNRQLNMLWKSASFDFDESMPLRDTRLVDEVGGIMQRQGSFQEALLGNRRLADQSKPRTGKLASR
jgi:hypothetical protein